mmetsp:Transcript_51584/g.85471  ORF Transcript_51584/g.85471 Transcript_51584/m.85471 type:complete len:210 (+) Transcript_51584:71-700(+)
MAQPVQYTRYHSGSRREQPKYKTETHKICPICGECDSGYFDKYYERDWEVLTDNGANFRCSGCFKEGSSVLYYHRYRCNKIFHLSCLTRSIQVQSGVDYIWTCCGGNQNAPGCQQRAIPVPKPVKQLENDIPSPSVAANVNQNNQNVKKKLDIAKNKECLICFNAEKTHAMVPCGHKCVCEGCAQAIQSSSNQCPVCRGNIQSVLKVFD